MLGFYSPFVFQIPLLPFSLCGRKGGGEMIRDNEGVNER
jgi:hypothetical protein